MRMWQGKEEEGQGMLGYKSGMVTLISDVSPAISVPPLLWLEVLYGINREGRADGVCVLV